MKWIYHTISSPTSTNNCTLCFRVKAAKDAEMCLSASDAQDAEKMIVIILGGSNNTKCAIRRDHINMVGYISIYVLIQSFDQAELSDF
jgi:hypothetical protein